MKVIIEATASPAVYKELGATATLRAEAIKGFTGSGGELVPPGNGNGKFYLEVPITITADEMLIPSFEIDSTEDAMPWDSAVLGDVPGYRFTIVTARGKKIPYMPQCRIRALTDNDTSFTWSELRSHNLTFRRRDTRSDAVINEDQVDWKIDDALGSRGYASETNLGVIGLVDDPIDPENPIALGPNSPQVAGGFVIYGSKYDSLNEAIAAITTLGGGTIVVDAPLPVTADVATDALISLRFEGQGILTAASAKIVTIVGPLVAPPIHIFGTNITAAFDGNRFRPYWFLEWFGGKSDGVTENRDFIHAMFTAIRTTEHIVDGEIVGGGRWLLPANTNYLYSPTGSYADSLDCFSQEASNIIIEGSGWSSVITCGGNFGLRFGLAYQTQETLSGAGARPWPVPAFAEFNDVTIGASSITLDSAGDSSLFAVGDVVYLQSGDAAPATGHSPYAFEFNEISAINAGSGIITLRHGVRHTFDSNDASYPPRIVKLPVAPKDIRLKNLRITRDASQPNTILDFGNTRDVTVRGCWLQGLFYTSYAAGVLFENNLIEQNELTNTSSFDIGDAAQDQSFKNNIIQHQGAYGVLIGGSFENITIERNAISGYARNSASGSAIFMGGMLRTRPPKGIRIINNDIVLDTATANGILVQNADGPIIEGNRIRGNLTAVGSAGIALVETVSKWRISGNDVVITGSNAAALFIKASDAADIITQGAAINNTLHGPAYGILLSNGGAGDIEKNQFALNDLAGSTARYRTNGYNDNTLDGISVTNMRGKTTISDATDAVLVPFDPDEDNTDYYVTITPSARTGTPAAGSEEWRITKQTDGFVIRLVAAPGVGNSVTFDWKVSR